MNDAFNTELSRASHLRDILANPEYYRYLFDLISNPDNLTALLETTTARLQVILNNQRYPELYGLSPRKRTTLIDGLAMILERDGYILRPSLRLGDSGDGMDVMSSAAFQTTIVKPSEGKRYPAAVFTVQRTLVFDPETYLPTYPTIFIYQRLPNSTPVPIYDGWNMFDGLETVFPLNEIETYFDTVTGYLASHKLPTGVAIA